jgi:hypothetical protein
MDTTTDLIAMSDEDFERKLAENLGNKLEFAKFITPPVVDATIDWITNRIDSVDAQLARYSNASNADPNWEQRTAGFRRLLVSRLATAERRVHAEPTSNADRERVWKEFAHQLAGAMVNDESDIGETFDALDTIRAPYGEITAREWLARRMEKDPTRVLVAA